MSNQTKKNTQDYTIENHRATVNLTGRVFSNKKTKPRKVSNGSKPQYFRQFRLVQYQSMPDPIHKGERIAQQPVKWLCKEWADVPEKEHKPEDLFMPIEKGMLVKVRAFIECIEYIRLPDPEDIGGKKIIIPNGHEENGTADAWNDATSKPEWHYTWHQYQEKTLCIIEMKEIFSLNDQDDFAIASLMFSQLNEMFSQLNEMFSQLNNPEMPPRKCQELGLSIVDMLGLHH